MIISFRHRFIFLHARKAAGSSISVSLLRYLGPRDIALGGIVDAAKFQISPPRRMVLDSLRAHHVRGLRHLLGGPEGFSKWVSEGSKAFYSRRYGLGSHSRGHALRRVFPQEFESFFTFAVTRNPFEKTYSDFLWRTRNYRSTMGFDEFVDRCWTGDRSDPVIPKNPVNWDIFGDQNGVNVDHIVPFSELTAGLEKVAREIGIPYDSWLPNAKKSSGEKGAYRSQYSNFARKKVGLLNEHEIEYFGYSF